MNIRLRQLSCLHVLNTRDLIFCGKTISQKLSHLRHGLIISKFTNKTIGNFYAEKRSLFLFPLGFHLQIFLLILGHLDECRHSYSIKLPESLQVAVSTNPVKDSKN